MGWTYTHRDSGHTTVDYFTSRWSNDYEFAKAATVGRTFYAACRRKRLPDEPFWAMVVLTDWQPKASDGYNFGWKDMTEHMGPYEATCPASVLDALGPTESQEALNWRRKCREFLARKAAVPKVRVGDTVEFKTELNFGKYGAHKQFKYVGTNCWQATVCGEGLQTWTFLCRISKWRERAFKVQEAA